MRYEKDENDHEIIISKMRDCLLKLPQRYDKYRERPARMFGKTNDEAAISRCRNTFCDRALDNVLSLLQYLILTTASSIVNN